MTLATLILACVLHCNNAMLIIYMYSADPICPFPMSPDEDAPKGLAGALRLFIQP